MRFYSIDAPVVRGLHLDGTRGPFCPNENDEDGNDDEIVDWFRCIYHFTITAIYQTHEGWEWLLFGDNKPPFLHLQERFFADSAMTYFP
ncbi:hypothetical protein AX15_002909 [Amanita polypyramis BW_CC]|nr:hypothetical protein AX15_002909 [Amanita polypyramis BW_CC]